MEFFVGNMNTIDKGYELLLTVLWTSYQFEWDDMDDYIQTIFIGESILLN